MKAWKVFHAEGSLINLTLMLNEIEGQGYVVHQVLPPDTRILLRTPLWPIVAYKLEAQP